MYNTGRILQNYRRKDDVFDMKDKIRELERENKFLRQSLKAATEKLRAYQGFEAKLIKMYIRFLRKEIKR